MAEQCLSPFESGVFKGAYTNSNTIRPFVFSTLKLKGVYLVPMLLFT